MAQSQTRPSRHSRLPSRTSTVSRQKYDAQRGAAARAKAQDDATINYIKRTLCGGADAEQTASKPLDELLPPLTSSNEVDVQLYALIAVILNQFVQAWYNKITPDQEFVNEIVQIIAHCTRAIEQRIRQVDLEALVLDEMPNLVASHIDAVQIAQRTARSSVLGQSNVRMVLHTLTPHVALGPPPVDESSGAAQRDNEAAWCRSLVDRVLPLLLPPEDLHDPCLRVFVSDVFADLIVQNGVCGKTCECWLIWEGVTRVIYLLRPASPPPIEGVSASPASRLEQFGLLSATRAGATTTTPGDAAAARRRPGAPSVDWIAQGFWTTLQLAVTTWNLLRTMVTALLHAASSPPRASPSTGSPNTRTAAGKDGADVNESNQQDDGRPIASMSIWSCISLVLCLERRMPWLVGLCSLAQWLALYGPGQLCAYNSALDRLMSLHIQSLILNPTHLPVALQAVRNAMFPGNAMAPPRPTPTPEETLRIKHECARAVVAAVPEAVRARFFATTVEESMRRDVEASLDLFGDAYVNKHLVIAAVELFALRLFPELLAAE